MTTDTFSLAANIAMRYCPDPVAAMRQWGFRVPTDTLAMGSGALDALPRNLRRAHDQLDPELSDRILQFLRDRLDGDDFNDLCAIIGVEPPAAEDPDQEEEPIEATGEQDGHPPEFEGRPNTGGAQDSSIRRLHKLMGRVTEDNMGLQPDPRRERKRQAQLAAQRAKNDAIFRAGGIAMDAGRSVQSFEQRFPGAGKIGHV